MYDHCVGRMYNGAQKIIGSTLSHTKRFKRKTRAIGSGGACKAGNFTLPRAQHIPGASFLNLNALQYVRSTSIFPMATLEWVL